MRNNHIRTERQFQQPYSLQSPAYLAHFLIFDGSSPLEDEFHASDCIFNPAEPFTVTLDFPELDDSAPEPEHVHFECPATFAIGWEYSFVRQGSIRKAIRHACSVLVRFFFSDDMYETRISEDDPNYMDALQTAARFYSAMGIEADLPEFCH